MLYEVITYTNYGVLYNWYSSITACPEGWHLPSFAEWTVLIDYLEYEYDIHNENTLNGAGNALKSCRITSYNVCYTKLLRCPPEVYVSRAGRAVETRLAK